jgi:hypothetical protein
VKLLPREGERLEFQLGHREMIHWLTLLSLYPCVPPAHHRLTRKTGEDSNATNNQALLDEALAEQREQQRENLRQLLEDRARCRENPDGGQLSLSPADAEWLLQVLNDIRVGSWIRLGSPETGLPPITRVNVRDIWAMEAAGHFQACLLEALNTEP